jgi:hypothetical protein
MADKFRIGDLVLIPWGLDEVRGIVAEVYGPALDRRVVVALTPELSSWVVDEPTTVAMPAEVVRPVVVTA